MDGNLDIVIILTVGFALASTFAYITHLLKLSPIPGYLLAGFIIGPYSPGYVADSHIAEQLAEIGVILMLFGVGLHFKLEDLISVKNIAIPGATVQTFVATLVSMLVIFLAGWSLENGIIIGLSIGVASTVVLVRVLTDNHLLNTPEGHVAVGWLVVEDIFTVIILILLPTLAHISKDASISFMGLGSSILTAFGKFLLLGLLMLTWGQRIVSYILVNVARMRSQEIFTLFIVAAIFMIATGAAYLFGTSIALGAFIAGMVIGKTQVRHQAAANSLPLKDVFAIFFFLSVGMIFNPTAVFSHYLIFIGLLAVILIVKPLSAYLITINLGYSLKIAVTVALALAQIGEFSFILAEEALKLQLLPEDGYDLLVGCALVSISLNPFLFNLLNASRAQLDHFSPPFRLRKKYQKEFIQKKPQDKLSCVIVGYGPTGRCVAAMMRNAGYSPMIIEQNIDVVANQTEQESIIFGNAAEINILKEAHIENASYLLITIPETSYNLEIIHTARELNSSINIISYVSHISEKHLMDGLHVTAICNERESLKAFTSTLYHSLRPIHHHFSDVQSQPDA